MTFNVHTAFLSLIPSKQGKDNEEMEQQEDFFLNLLCEESKSCIVPSQPQKTELKTAHIFISFMYSVLICWTKQYTVPRNRKWECKKALQPPGCVNDDSSYS